MIQKVLKDYSYTEIPFDSKDYPHKLRKIKNPPEKLYALGNLSLLRFNKPTVAIVGTRKISDLGAIKTKRITEYFANRGYTIVSGLALGVDTIAIKTALSCDAKVIAVLPSIKDISPRSNKNLAYEIVKKNGLLLSEFEKGIRKYMFVQRNRIISGIADLIVVVETDVKGGTMYTVKFAKEQGKKILVADLPASGNLKLIKEEQHEILRV